MKLSLNMPQHLQYLLASELRVCVQYTGNMLTSLKKTNDRIRGIGSPYGDNNQRFISLYVQFYSKTLQTETLEELQSSNFSFREKVLEKSFRDRRGLREVELAAEGAWLAQRTDTELEHHAAEQLFAGLIIVCPLKQKT